MNTSFYFSVAESKITNWKEVMTGWVTSIEQEWSRFRVNNELDQLNHLEIGEKMSVSPPLFDILNKAEGYRLKTKGLFSPYLLTQMQFHGYDHSFPFDFSNSVNEVIPFVYRNEIGPFEFDHQEGTIKRMNDGKVDLGGIGKGYTVNAAARWLKHIGEVPSGMVDGGGDITVWSNGEKEWTIGVAHPYQNDVDIAQFRLKNGSIATSNIVHRSWKQGKEKKHHLLNGKTGLPVESDIIQATVISENCLDAEVAAKLCFMEDQQKLSNLLKKINLNLTYLLVTSNGNIITHEGSYF